MESAKPPFRGWVNGVYIFPGGDPGPPESAGVPPCWNSELRYVPEEELQSGAHAIRTPAYLPPGTFEVVGPYGTACEDNLSVAVRRFDLLPHGGHVIVLRYLGIWFRGFGASADRIEGATVGGRPAVLIRPVTDEGFGTSAVILRESSGIIQVGALNLPFGELLRVAESL